MSATKLSGGEPSEFVRSVAAEVNGQMGRRGRMSAVRLAKASGLPYRTLVRCLGGARPFAVDELEKIAAVLDCSVSDFVSPPPPTGTRTISRKSRDSHRHFATAA